MWFWKLGQIIPKFTFEGMDAWLIEISSDVVLIIDPSGGGIIGGIFYASAIEKFRSQPRSNRERRLDWVCPSPRMIFNVFCHEILRTS
jgi:hypothetical protein